MSRPTESWGAGCYCAKLQAWDSRGDPFVGLRDPSVGELLPNPKKIPARQRLIFALDFADHDSALDMVETLGDSVQFYKTGLQIFLAGNYIELAATLHDLGKRTLVDLKFFDVPETVALAVEQLRRIHADFATVHGNDMALRAAVSRKNGVKILAVTVLTSLDDADIQEFGFQGIDVRTLVLSRARRALEAGCDGVISSGLEADAIRREHGDRVLIVTPGIRPVANVDDQKRTVDVEDAFRNGADYIVVGRPIRDAEDPKAKAEEIQERIAALFGPD